MEYLTIYGQLRWRQDLLDKVRREACVTGLRTLLKPEAVWASRELLSICYEGVVSETRRLKALLQWIERHSDKRSYVHIHEVRWETTISLLPR